MNRMNYWDYIKVEELLALQGGLSDEPSRPSNDEVLFITVHQIYELWFKLLIREIESVRDLLRTDGLSGHQVAPGVRSLRRAVVIFGQASHHFQVMETLTTRDFLDFRDRLAPASGFQSAQLREIEILVGLEDTQRISIGHGKSYVQALALPNGEPSVAARRVQSRAAGEPSLKHCLYDWLSHLPIDGMAGPAAVARFLQDYIHSLRRESQQRLQSVADSGAPPGDIEKLHARYAAECTNAEQFLLAQDDPEADEATREKRRAARAAMVCIESHRELPQLAWPRELLEGVLDLEQAMLIWRQRHARMVERMVGRRAGTGGSSGVEYLDQTALRYRIFADLWVARSLLLRKSSVPGLPLDASLGLAPEGLQ